jgi:hypothetical protein
LLWSYRDGSNEAQQMSKTHTIVTIERKRTENTYVRGEVQWFDDATNNWITRTQVDVRPGDRQTVQLREHESIKIYEIND